MEVLLRILETTVPALVVFATIYVFLGMFFKKERDLRESELRIKAAEVTVPVRLGAYERLSVLLDRIQLAKVFLRVSGESMRGNDLHIAMIIAVEQEFEHNVSQQIYVSHELWEIISMAKNEAIGLISNHYKKVGGDNPTAQQFGQSLINSLNEEPQLAMHKAQEAIKKEISVTMFKH